MDVDVSDCDNLPDVTDKIMRELFRENGKAHCEEMVVRITLEGATPLHPLLERPGVLADLRKHVNDCVFGILLRHADRRHGAAARQGGARREGLFPAVFLQVADAQRADLERGGLCAGRVPEEERRAAQRLRRAIDDLAEEAENLVLDLLSQGDDR